MNVEISNFLIRKQLYKAVTASLGTVFKVIVNFLLAD